MWQRPGRRDRRGGLRREAAAPQTERPSHPAPAPPPWFPDDSADSDDESVAPAGYRILRRLGEGSRAYVYLGRSIVPGLADAALKIFSPGTTDDSINAEASVLEVVNGVGSAHVVRLLDVAHDGRGVPCLVLAPCAAGDLPGLLSRRGAIEPGEAVTVLAPVIEALGALHAAGWSHGALRTSSILFDAAGAPVLSGWGHAVRLAVARSGPKGDDVREANARAKAADIDRFLALTCDVLDRLSPGVTPTAVDALRTRLVDRARTSDVVRPDDLADLLYDFAEPLPVGLAGDQTGAPRSRNADRRVSTEAVRSPRFALRIATGVARYGIALPAAGGRSQRDEPDRGNGQDRGGGPDRGNGPDRGGDSARGNGPDRGGDPARGNGPDRAGDPAQGDGPDRAGDPARNDGFPPGDGYPPGDGSAPARTTVSHSTRRTLGSVRPLVWVGAAIPVLALVALLVFGALAGSVAGRTAVPELQGNAPPGSVRVPGAEAPAPEVSPAVVPVPDASRISSDDPVLAASALLAAREECYRTLSVLCLDSVAAEGSVALEADRNAVRALQEGRATTVPPLSGLSPVLVERLGDSALLELSPTDGREAKPASLLLQRGEAGWRIRSVLVD
jgi:hypothetical protein